MFWDLDYDLWDVGYRFFHLGGLVWFDTVWFLRVLAQQLLSRLKSHVLVWHGMVLQGMVWLFRMLGDLDYDYYY